MQVMPKDGHSTEDDPAEEDPKHLYLLGPRHIDCIDKYTEELPPWRLKDRMKTVSVALVLCLNLHVDPPDIIKTNPCARLECWFDPHKCNLATKPIKQIGNKLQKQYETWQRRARYKQSLDPTIDDVQALCTSLRRNAKEERVLFHYNGHGVPRPTDNGEIWVFNTTYTQYIPLLVYNLQTWLGSPSIYVYDCSNAGVLLKHFTPQGVCRQANDGSDDGDSSGENYPDNTTITAGPSDHPGAAAAGGGPVAQQLPAAAAAATQPSQQQLQAKLKMPQNLSELQQQVFRDKQMRLMSTQQREEPLPPQLAPSNSTQDNCNMDSGVRSDVRGPPGSNHSDPVRQQGNYNQFQPNLPTLRPINPNLVKGNPNFQVNPMPGQENINIPTSLGPILAPNGGSERNSPQPFMVGECIHLCACNAGELLPMCPELPADVFTACLTTPITMAVRWFLLQRHSSANAPPPLHIADKIPGELNDRRTVLGELNWIFTAITDTIAWNALPLELFQKLFRQDLLVASLFRNFLLAERIMRSYGCTPVSLPKLPPTHSHPMWQSWDLSLQHCLSQLWPNLALTLSSGSGSVPDSVANKAGHGLTRSVASAAAATAKSGQATGNGATGGKALGKNGSKEAQYLALPANIQSLQLPFFQCQLSAFQVWLELPHHNREPPEQLPVLLQVLLSQVYRPHALELLCSFLALGRWAVHLVLSVGIFPYILKLLQSTSRDLRPKLVTLWAKILAVEQTCKADLVREGGFQYFLEVLADTTMQPEHRGMAAFILAVMAKDEPEVQKKLLIPICLEQITNSTLPLPYDGDNTTYDYTIYDRHDMYADACVRMWPAVCLAATWHCAPDVRWSATRDNAHEKLFALLKDPVPEVRAASIYALGSFLGSLPLSEHSDEQARTINNSIAVTLCNSTAQFDASPIVRMELAVALQFVVLLYESSFTQLVASQIVEQDDRYRNPHMNQSFSGVCRTPNRAHPGSGSSYSDASDILTAILSPTAHLSLSRRTGPGASCHGSGGVMHRAASVHAINSSVGGGSWCGSVLSSSGLYAKLWQAMQGLARDPHQAVANIARIVINNITEKAEASLASTRRGSGGNASADDSSIDLRALSLSGGSSHYRNDSPPASGRSTPRSKPLANAYPSGEQFITPLVQSPLPVWGARLLVTPVYCPLDTPPAVQHFKNMNDLILTRTALQTPCDKPVNPRLLTRLAEQQLMLELSKPSTDSVGGTPRSRPRPRPKLNLEVLNEKLNALPSVLLFHPVTPHLVVCDKTHVSTYNLERSELVNRWPNHPMPSQRITSACVINYNSETPLLAVAADDGSVRVWKDPFNRTRTHVRGYGCKDPYFKTNWLEAKSGTSTSKTSKPNRDFPSNDSMVYGWKRKGSNLFVGNTYVGDNLGGFLGDGCRSILRSEDVLMGGFFSKGYGWHNAGGSGKGSPAVANTPSPSGGSGWGASAWVGGNAAVAAPPPPVNGWATGSNKFLEARPSESTLVTPVLVTAFTATTNVRPGMKGPGPLLSWCQQSGRLAVAGGEYRTIRLWDMRTELHSGDLLHSNATAANYAACITALHSRGSLITAGFSDGCVMLLDSRVGVSLPGVVGALGRSTSGGRSARERCVLQDWKEDEAWVLCSQLKDDYTILAGSVSGAVHLLDARNRGSITLLQASSEITAMDANLSQKLFAFGTVSQSLTVHRVDGQTAPAVNTIQCSDGFLGGQRASPIAAVAFHPDRPLLAAAANNSTVAVYGLQHR